MKRLMVSVLAAAVLFGTACSFDTGGTGGGSGGDSSEDQTDQSVQTDSTNSTTFVIETSDIEFYYPDQLMFVEAGTLCMTIYRCGNGYYACVDGERAWKSLYGEPPIELEDCQFIHVEADIDLVYGGVKGFWGNPLIREVRDERYLTLDEVADCRILDLYDPEEATFTGARLIVKDGKNYLICRGTNNQYRLYDSDGNLLCAYDTSMAAAAYLDDDADHTIEYSSAVSLPCYIVRIDGVYYAYFNHVGMNTWKPLLNMHFENKPYGFELEDGQVMSVRTARVYVVNGGKAGYVDVPMFENMSHYERVIYSSVNGRAAAYHWEETVMNGIAYENGDMYQYYYGLDEYMIFYLDGEFYVYHEYYSDLDSQVFVGKYATPEEVTEAIGWKTE